MTTKKKRTVGLLSIVIIIAAALVIALWVVPFAQMASYRGSETVQAHAAQLVADYEAETGETVSQEDVCRDMSYLDRLWIYEGTLPTEITGTREGRLVYAMPFTDMRPSILMSTVPAAAPFITSSKATMASARAA